MAFDSVREIDLAEAIEQSQAAILALFDQGALKDPPRYLAQIGCRDGAWLKQLYALIGRQTHRGASLQAFPLTLIAIVDDEKAWDKTAHALQGLPYIILPASHYESALAAHGIDDQESIFYLYFNAKADAVFGKESFVRWSDKLNAHGWLVLAAHDAQFDAETGLLLAAEAGLFARAQPLRFSKAGPVCSLSLSHFEKRDYRIRRVRPSDLNVLNALEQDCWPEALQTPPIKLARRLALYPEGQFVLELNGQVIGVIYSQRIEDRSLLLTVSAESADCLHCPDGPVVQLIAVNIAPEMQHRALGDQLLEFMLQRCSLMNGVSSVAAVTRCKDYSPESGMALDDYIGARNAQGRLLDPVLRFHELHGAHIECLAPDYRPFDRQNKGHGVLVHYDIHRRCRDELQADISESVHPAPLHEVTAFVAEAVKSCLGPSGIDVFAAERSLMEMGLDSADLLQLGERIGFQYKIKLEPAFFFHHSTAEKISHQLCKQLSTSETPCRGELIRPERSKQTQPDQDIAIVGISGCFPGAQDLDAFWQNILEGKDCIGEIPIERWDWRAIAGGQSNRWGGFIEGVKAFDPGFFNVSPRDAQCMDPQLRLLLQHSWWALEDAGIAPEAFSKAPTGVFVAAAPGEYVQRIADLRPEDGLYLFTSSIPNRLSQFFDLQGPSECYEAACASSLLAIHRAVQSISLHECGQAVVAAVNLILSPMRHSASEALGYLSPDGQTRSFQADANGFVRSEGVGALILKPLSEALAAGDRIHAVIKGTAVAHGGKGLSLTAPHSEGMKTAMVKAYQAAGIDPGSVSYIEAHGVASPLSDALEIEALKGAYGALASGGERPVHIGSLKPCIGHAEVASGMAALFKLILAMRHRTIPGLPRFKTLHEQVCLEGSPFQISPDNIDWQASVDAEGRPMPRRASINGYGDAGLNAHLVLEECLDERQYEPGEDRAYLIVLSAKSDERLIALASRLELFLKTTDCHLLELSHGLQMGRKAMEHRAAWVVKSIEQLIQCLQEHIKAPPSGRIPADDAKIQALISGMDEADWLNRALNSNDLQALAAYWTAGGHVPWENLYQGRLIRRLGLPAYPFAQDDYWVESKPFAPIVPAGLSEGLSDDLKGLDFLKHEIGRILGLSIEALPPDIPLYSLGFTSLHALSLKAALERRYGAVIPVSSIDVYRSLAELDKQLAYLSDTVEAREPLLPVIQADPDARYQPFPLSDIQQAFLLGRRLDAPDEQVGCHVYLEMDCEALDIYRLNQSWNRLIAHHDMLRVVFENGRQRVLEAVADYRFKVLDLRKKSEPARLDALTAVRAQLSHQVYPGDGWPLFEIRISLLPDNLYRIHFSMDELIVDASAVESLFRQWQALYKNPSHILPALELSFRDYCLAMRDFESSARYQTDLRYWQAKLENLPEGPKLPSGEGHGAERARLKHTLASVHWQVLKDKAAGLNVSPTALLLAIFSWVLQAECGQPRFTLILTLLNRLPIHPQVAEVVAPFISTSLFVFEAGDEDSLESLIEKAQKTLLSDLDHSTVSGIRVLRLLKHDRKMALPVVFTSLLGRKTGRDSNSFLEKTGFTVTQTPQVYLDHQVYEQEGELRFSWDIAKAHFSAGLMDKLFADYCRLLTALASDEAQWRIKIADRARPSVAQVFEWCPQGEQALALTDQQQAYAFGKSAYGAGIASQFYSRFELDHLDMQRLQRAWHNVLDAHEMLVTVVNPDGTQTCLQQKPGYAIAVADLRAKSPAELEAELGSIEQAMLERNCPLGSWPYFELRVSLLDSGKAMLHLCVELLIADAPSVGLLQQQLFKAYENPDDAPVKAKIRYADYLWSLQKARKSDRLCHSYWTQKFADIPPGPSFPHPPLPEGEGVLRTARLEGMLEAWPVIKETAGKLKVRPCMVLLAAYAEVLAAWSDSERFTLVMPVWDRLPIHAEIDRLVGDFTAMSWLVVSRDGLNFEQKVCAYQQTLQNDLAHRLVSGLSVLRQLALQRRREKALSFPVVFTDLEPSMGSGIYPCRALSQTAGVDLDNISTDYGERLGLHWDVAQGRYPEGMVEAMFAGYSRLLNALAENPSVWHETDFSALIDAKPEAYADFL